MANVMRSLDWRDAYGLTDGANAGAARMAHAGGRGLLIWSNGKAAWFRRGDRSGGGGHVPESNRRAPRRPQWQAERRGHASVLKDQPATPYITMTSWRRAAWLAGRL